MACCRPWSRMPDTRWLPKELEASRASLGVERQLGGTEAGAAGNRSCSPDPRLGVAVEGFPSPLLSVRPSMAPVLLESSASGFFRI